MPSIPQLDFNTPPKQNSSEPQQQSEQRQSSPHGQQQPQQPPLPQLKNYVLGQTIGQGTFNKVKIARHIPTNQKVAIKIIDKASIVTQSDKHRLSTQIKILRKVRHPNIAQLFQIFQSKDKLFLVAENASRGQLFEHILQNQKLTEFQACRFLQQLLDAVQYIHQLGVSHRDLKPENILLDYKFNIKLIDFGLSNIYSKGQYLRTPCGSPCYAPPEMLSGMAYDGLKSDIWSIGVILYAMCFGFLPFDNPNTKELYDIIKTGSYDVPQHASRELRSILRIILEVDPQKRATIDLIRGHPFCQFSPVKLTPGIIVGLSDIPYEEQIEKEIIQDIANNPSSQFDCNDTQQLKTQLKQSVKFNKHNSLSATYYLILQRKLRQSNSSVVSYYISKNNVVNRYEIAGKVKEIYQKRLKEKIMTKQHQQNQITKKNKIKSKSKSKYDKSAKTQKKYRVQQLYTNNESMQYSYGKENILKDERRLKTTNSKRKKEEGKQKMFKKTRLNFNQIQLYPQAHKANGGYLDNKRSPEKSRKGDKGENGIERRRNKSSSHNSNYLNRKPQQSPAKFSHQSPQKPNKKGGNSVSATKKNRSNSLNNTIYKIKKQKQNLLTRKTDHISTPDRPSTKKNTHDDIKNRSDQKMSSKKIQPMKREKGVRSKGL